MVEARNRVGGRVLSFGDLVPGRTMEGGAELIGSNHPAWVAYKDLFKLEFLDITEDESAEYPIILDGRRLDRRTTEMIGAERLRTGRFESSSPTDGRSTRTR